jgi:glutathione S-transferase
MDDCNRIRLDPLTMIMSIGFNYAEGSAVTLFGIRPIRGDPRQKAASLQRRVDFEMNLNLSFIDCPLAESRLSDGNQLTAADIQMSFVGALAAANVDVALYPNVDDYRISSQDRRDYSLVGETHDRTIHQISGCPNRTSDRAYQ